jgi:hypothetical protein
VAVSAHYPEILRYVAAASLDELEALRAHVSAELVRRRHARNGLDADELVELERRDTLPSPAPTPRPLTLDEPGDL